MQSVPVNFLDQPAMVPGLPENLRFVPPEPEQWRLWREAVAAYREVRRRDCTRDVRQQRIEYERCRRDPAYFIIVWGVIFEARTQDETVPPSWKPFIMFPFQVQFIRWIEWVLTQREHGRGDGVSEKSRDMGATNLYAAFAVHHFLFETAFVCGFISKKFEDVDRRNSPDTIFYKIRAMLGILDAVPPQLRLPTFLKPKGFELRWHAPEGEGAIGNPEPSKTCFLIGETTTKLSAVGGRATMRVNDEAARFQVFGQTWNNQQATTDHRFANSSADIRFGRSFYNLARRGEEALLRPDMAAPSFIRLKYDLHPFHTPAWFSDQRARAASEGDIYDFAREYEIEYFAGQGSEVYPRFMEVKTGDYPYDPLGGPVYCWIDPGTRDPTAIIWAQADTINGYWNVVDSFESKGGEDTSFYASLLTGVYLSGEHQYDYDAYPGLHTLMEFTVNISQPIQYVGDPAGNQRGGRGDEKSTFYRQLALDVKDITNGQQRIHVQGYTADDARSYIVRTKAVNELLPRFRFHNNAGGTRVLFCLQNSKYAAPTNSLSALEPTKPVHDEFSHIRSAYEYGNVALVRMGTRTHRTNRVKPTRISLSGNVVSGRQNTLFKR